MGLFIRKKSGRYYATFYDEEAGRKREKALGTSDSRVAKSKAKEWEVRWANGEDPFDNQFFQLCKRTESSRLSDCVSKFIESKRQSGRAPDTIRAYTSILGLLQDDVGKNTSIHSIKPKDIAEFIEQPDNSDATSRNYLRHVKAFFRWCCKSGFIKKNPVSDVEYHSETKEKLPKYVTEKQLEAICDAIRADYAEKRRKRKEGEGLGGCQEGELLWYIPLFQFAFYTGLRASEIARLRWKDILYDQKMIVIHQQKSRKESTIPLSRKAKAILQDVPHGEPADFVFRSPDFTDKVRSARSFASNISKRVFLKYRREAGIDHVTFHGLRHGFVSHLCQQGVHLTVVKELARHADLSTTLRYVHLTGNHLRDAVNEAFA